jgi:3-isopropylmalate dehydrogenase
MMLDHIGETEMAEKIRNAVLEVVQEGKVRTYDMMKLKGSPEVLDNGAVSTTGMTDAIIAKL